MPNTFLGFPVSRAKVADMISGAMPPSYDYNIQDLPQSIDQWQNVPGAGGAFSISSKGLYVKSDKTSAAATYGFINLQNTIYGVNWSKLQGSVYLVVLNGPTASGSLIRIRKGDALDQNAIGFRIIADLFQAYTRVSGTIYPTTIEALGSDHYEKTHRLRWQLTPAVKVEFWVDEILVHTETAHIPTGSTDAQYLVNTYCKSAGGEYDSEIYLRMWTYNQVI